MIDQDKTCHTCCWGTLDDLADLVCVNGDSERRADWVGPDDTCDCWEAAEGQGRQAADESPNLESIVLEAAVD